MKMAFSEEDKHVIKFVRQNKHYGAKRFLKEFPHKSWSCGGLDKIIRKIDRAGTSKRLPGSGRPCTARTADNSVTHLTSWSTNALHWICFLHRFLRKWNMRPQIQLSWWYLHTGGTQQHINAECWTQGPQQIPTKSQTLSFPRQYRQIIHHHLQRRIQTFSYKWQIQTFGWGSNLICFSVSHVYFFIAGDQSLLPNWIEGHGQIFLLDPPLIICLMLLYNPSSEATDWQTSWSPKM